MESLLNLQGSNLGAFTLNLLYAILLSLALFNHAFCTAIFKKAPTEWEQPQQWILSMGLVALVLSFFSFVLYTLTYSVFLSFFLTVLGAFALKTIAPIFLFMVTHFSSLSITGKCIQKAPPALSQKLRSFLPLLYIQSSLLTATFIYLTHKTTDFLVTSQRITGTAAGFILILIIFESMVERLETAPIPHALKGTAIHALTLGILSLALVGLSGTLIL
jgi:Na+-translocating ferredoxin:NAD+ oxidoreductase subunit A